MPSLNDVLVIAANGRTRGNWTEAEKFIIDKYVDQNMKGLDRSTAVLTVEMLGFATALFITLISDGLKAPDEPLEFLLISFAGLFTVITALCQSTVLKVSEERVTKVLDACR